MWSNSFAVTRPILALATVALSLLLAPLDAGAQRVKQRGRPPPVESMPHDQHPVPAQIHSPEWHSPGNEIGRPGSTPSTFKVPEWTPTTEKIKLPEWQPLAVAVAPLSKAEVRFNRAREESILTTKALVGRVANGGDLFNAQITGKNLWTADLNQVRSQARRTITKHAYDDFTRQKFEDTWKRQLEGSVAREAGNRGYLIFTGAWTKGSSLVSLSEPYSTQSIHSFIDRKQVAHATLYLPYVAGLAPLIKNNDAVTKATAPLIAIDQELFSDETAKAIRHREFLLDPRVDARSYEFNDGKPIELRALESRQLEFEPGRAEPATIAKLLGCCVYVRPPAYSAALVAFLKAVRFDVQQLRIALMVHDSATRSHLAGDVRLSGQGRAEAINRNTTDVEGWIVSQLKKASGGTLLLLGHVEGKDYVVRDASGAKVGRIDIQRTNELALHHRVTLFNLGCKTAGTLRDHDGIGVYDAFNSIHMLRTISTALGSGPKTIADFLEKLGTPEAKIVIPAKIMRDASLLAALKDLRDADDKKVADGKWLRIPAIQPIVSPSRTTMGFPTSLSVFLTSARQNALGFSPVVAELHIVMDACKVLAAAKSLGSGGDANLTCKRFRSTPYKPVTTHLYGYPERKFR